MLSFKGSTSLSRFDDLSICAYASLTTAFALLYINDPYPTPPKISRKNGIKMNHFIDFLLERFYCFSYSVLIQNHIHSPLFLFPNYNASLLTFILNFLSITLQFCKVTAQINMYSISHYTLVLIFGKSLFI